MQCTQRCTQGVPGRSIAAQYNRSPPKSHLSVSLTSACSLSASCYPSALPPLSSHAERCRVSGRPQRPALRAPVTAISTSEAFPVQNSAETWQELKLSKSSSSERRGEPASHKASPDHRSRPAGAWRLSVTENDPSTQLCSTLQAPGLFFHSARARQRAVLQPTPRSAVP